LEDEAILDLLGSAPDVKGELTTRGGLALGSVDEGLSAVIESLPTVVDTGEGLASAQDWPLLPDDVGDLATTDLAPILSVSIEPFPTELSSARDAGEEAFTAAVEYVRSLILIV